MLGNGFPTFFSFVLEHDPLEQVQNLPVKVNHSNI
jgi:hypothetical protein